MNVLQIVACFPPAYDYGGPVTSVYNLSKALVDCGHNVTVYTTDALDADSRVKYNSNPEIVDGIEIYRFRNLSHSLAWKFNLTNAIGMGRALQNHISDFDVVHIHEYRFPEAVFAGYFARSEGIPYVLQPRGSVPRSTKSKQKKLFDSLFGKSLLDSCARLIASSRIESEQFSDVIHSVSNKDISHVPNGIDIHEYENLPSAGGFRNSFDIDDSADMILFLSRLHERKGGDLLINAMSDLDDDSTKLVFVGPDEGHLEDLNQMAKNNGLLDSVLFPGPLYGQQKLEAYVDADVFVLPSKNQYESFGNVVIEAMACGTPAVMTDVCGVSEWINTPHCQIVTPDSDSIKKGVNRMLRHQTDNGKAIRDEVLSTFDWNSIARSTEKIYEDVLVS